MAKFILINKILYKILQIKIMEILFKRLYSTHQYWERKIDINMLNNFFLNKSVQEAWIIYNLNVRKD